MSLSRISYWDLPMPVRSRVEKMTGAVASASPVGAGLNSSVAAVVRATQGSFFVKALPTNHRWAWTQARESEIAPHVRPVAPELLARVADHSWDVLVFDALDGRHATYEPGSSDLRIIAGLLNRIGALECPDDVEVREAPLRLQAYAADADLHYFAGQALLHTDLNSANIIIRGTEAHIVDWGWVTRGAPWLDAGYWVIWLIAAGHEPPEAERWAGRVRSWQHAPQAGIDAFAAANALLWKEIAGPRPDAFTAPLAAAASRWRDYRRADESDHRNSK